MWHDDGASASPQTSVTGARDLSGYDCSCYLVAFGLDWIGSPRRGGAREPGNLINNIFTRKFVSTHVNNSSRQGLQGERLVVIG